MTSSSKDRVGNNRDDCQIHVDKEGESCVIKIESVGQEKMLKELLGRFNSLKSEVNQLLSSQQKQQQPKEMLDAIQDMTAKLKPLEDQLQKMNKNVGDDHIQLNKFYTDLNKKFDEIKQDLNSSKEQQKNIGSSKDTMEKILQKLENLDKILKNSQDEGQKRLSSDLQNLKQQIPSKNEFKPVLDAIQALQSSFDKEKIKPDILARKIDSIDQKLKESHPEHMAVMKDIQTKIEPLHKATPQTSETLTKINDRVKAMHADTAKPHPELLQKLDNIDQHLKNQQNSLIEPMKQILNEKINPFIEQQKKDGEEKLGSPNITERDNHTDSPSRVPLCVNGMIPVLCKLSDPHVLEALVGDIAKKLGDIQTKLSSSDDLKRKQDDFIGNLTKQQTPLIDEIKRLTPILDKLKQQQQKDSENLNRQVEKSFQPITQKLNDLTKQQDLIKNIDLKLNNLSQNIDKENDLKKRSDTQPDIAKEISTRTQPLQQAVENLSKQQQPLMEIIRELPKKLDDIRQSQPQSGVIKELSSKLDPLIQTIQANKDRDNQALMNLDKKLNQALTEPQKRSDTKQDIEKALQPFSQIIKTLKDSIDQSQAQKQNETKKLDNLEQRLSKTLDTSPQTSDIIGKLNEITKNLKQTDPTIQKLSDDLGTIKTMMEKQTTPDEILSKINDITQKQKAPFEAALKDMHAKVEPLHQASKDPLNTKKKNDDMDTKMDKLIDLLNQVNDQIQPTKIGDPTRTSSPDLMNTLKKLDDQLTHLNNNLPAMGDIPKQIGSLKDALDKFKQNENNNVPSHAIKDINDRLKSLDETMKGLPDQISSKSKRLAHDDDKNNAANLRQVPLSQSTQQDSNNLMATQDGQIPNLFANLLTLQTAIQNSDNVPYQDIQQYLKRIEQSPLVQTDRDLQGLVQRVKELCLNNKNNTKSNLNIQNPYANKNPNTSNSNIQNPDSDQNSTTSNSNLQNPDSNKNPARSNYNIQNLDPNKDSTTSNSNIQNPGPNKNSTTSSSNLQNPDSNKHPARSNFNMQNPDSHKDSTTSNSILQNLGPNKNSITSSSNLQNPDSNKNSATSSSNLQNPDQNKDSTRSNSNIQNPDQNKDSTTSNSNMQNPDSNKNSTRSNFNLQNPDSNKDSTRSNSSTQNPDFDKNSTTSSSNIQNPDSNKNSTTSSFNLQNPDQNKNPVTSNFNMQNPDSNKNFTKGSSTLQRPDPNKNPTESNSSLQNPESNKNSTNRTNSVRNGIDNTPSQQQSEIDNSENRRNGNKISLPPGYLTKSRYISLLSDRTIRNNWPKLSSKSTPVIESIVNQPLEFDNGTNIDGLIKQNGLERYASLTRNAIEKSDKDYDKISYMMDSIVFDKMTMIGSREALIRPWDPSLLNRASSKGSYPYPSGNNREIERFKVNKDISLWMVETDESKPYNPTEFLPNVERLNEKYERIQQPQFSEIRQNRREDETRWNERYAFTKDNRKILFVNDLRSYFMDYDTKRKYQVHDGVPINPVCRTGIAGRGDLPFWGPNHCVVVILLRNINEPEVVLMRHHGDAFVLPKGFYGHEARYDNQIKIIQDPVSGQILPPNLFDYWWSNVIKLNEMNHSINNLKRVLNDKELKEEFAEIFSQKGCNKSVFDNGYVDHPLNTDHAWVESSVWKIQLKDWRIPEMKSAKYTIADDFKNNNTCPFIWMKLTDAILIVPPFDRGILVDVLATGMPL